MFVYNPDYFMYEPRNSPSFYPRTRNLPCSYYSNRSPFCGQPVSFYYFTPQNHSSYDEEDQRERLLREHLNRKMAYRQQEEEYEREQEERLKRFYEHKARQQAKQPGASTFTANYQPKKSFKVKIQEDDDETKSSVNKSQAAQKIFNFIKNQSANKQTRKILNKLHTLRTIENELKEIHRTKNFGNLTFNGENEKRVLPISIENKRFLEYENKIVEFFDKLDGIQSEGVDIIRERRKFLVKFAQTLLDELDNEKVNQWKVFNGALEKVDKNFTTNDSSEIISPTIEENSN